MLRLFDPIIILRILVVGFANFCATASVSPAAHVWVQGESGRGENISRNGWYQIVRGEELSGGKLLAADGGKSPVTAIYTVTIPKTESYTLRVSTKLIPLRGGNEPILGGIIGQGQLKNIGVLWSDGGDFQVAGRPGERFKSCRRDGPEIHSSISCQLLGGWLWRFFDGFRRSWSKSDFF